MQEREIGDLKMNRLIARIYHYLMVTEAAVSSSAVLSSVPLAILNVLPTWADIVLAGGGLLIAPPSIIETSTTKRWMKDAEQLVDNWEQNHPE